MAPGWWRPAGRGPTPAGGPAGAKLGGRAGVRGGAPRPCPGGPFAAATAQHTWHTWLAVTGGVGEKGSIAHAPFSGKRSGHNRATGRLVRVARSRGGATIAPPGPQAPGPSDTARRGREKKGRGARPQSPRRQHRGSALSPRRRGDRRTTPSPLRRGSAACRACGLQLCKLPKTRPQEPPPPDCYGAAELVRGGAAPVAVARARAGAAVDM